MKPKFQDIQEIDIPSWKKNTPIKEMNKGLLLPKMANQCYLYVHKNQF